MHIDGRDELLRKNHEEICLSRRGFMLRAAGVGGSALLFGSASRSAAWTEAAGKGLTANALICGEGTDLVGQSMDERVTRNDVQRFGRIVNLMTAEQRRMSGEGLPKVQKLPDELSKSLNTEETETALLMLSWMSRWKRRHEEPRIQGRVTQAPDALCRAWPLSGIPTGLVAPTSQSAAATLPASASLSRQVCEVVQDRLRNLEKQTDQAIGEANTVLSHGKAEYQAAREEYARRDKEIEWSHILEAMKDVNHLIQHTARVRSTYSEFEGIVRTLGQDSPCRKDAQDRLSRLYAAYRTASDIGVGDSASTELWRLHFALIRLAQEIDQGQATDPSVPCVDLSQTGDFWNWFWKQVRGGGGGDTNPPGWFPVDLFNVVQAAFGTIRYINMEPDGDIHINLGAFNLPGWPSVNALTNGNDPDGQLICEIPLCDRWWFPNLSQVCVGKLAYVVGKWMIDVWNGWYELHPLYDLYVFTPVIVG